MLLFDNALENAVRDNDVDLDTGATIFPQSDEIASLREEQITSYV